MAFDGHMGDAGKLHDMAGAAGNGNRHLLGADLAPCRRHANDFVAVAQEAGDLAILDDVDAAPVSSARIAPGDRVVPGGAGARLHQPAKDGKARRTGDVQRRDKTLDLVDAHQLGVDPEMTHRIAAPCIVIELSRRVREIEAAALGEHDVVVEVVREVLP